MGHNTIRKRLIQFFTFFRYLFIPLYILWNYFISGLDGETFFLYVFLAAGIVLLLVIGQQTLLSVGKKRSSTSTAKKPTQIETGTNNPNNVDYDWLPKQTLANLSKFLTLYLYK